MQVAWAGNGLEGVTHQAILSRSNHGDRRKSPSVPVAAMAFFADRRDRRINRRYLACQISAIKLVGIHQVRHRVSETLSYLSFEVSKDIIYHRSELLKLTSRALAQVRQS